MKIGELIKYIREYNGITRSAISKIISVKIQQIGSLERSDHLIRLDTLEKVLKCLKINEMQFFYIKHVLNGGESYEIFVEENKIIEFIKRRINK